MRFARFLRRVPSVVAFIAILVVSAVCIARPGGGSSFSGSSSSGSSRSTGGSTSSGGSRGGSTSSGGWGSSSSSGSFSSGSYSSSAGGSSGGSYWGSSSAEFTFFILPFGLLFLGLVVVQRYRGLRRRLEWEARGAREADDEVREVREEREARHGSITAALAALRSADDAFSFVLFEDFLYALYAEVHTARGGRKLEWLASYVAPDAREKLASYGAVRVSTIVIGGMRVASITTLGQTLTVLVDFTTNLTEVDAEGESRAYYMEERWELVRDATAKSRPPERARIIGCPSCGAPLNKTIGQECEHCGAEPRPGEVDWLVVNIEVRARERRGPMLTGTTEEVGTDFPTVVAPDARTELDALRARNPAFAWPGFVARIERIFSTFHVAWSAQDLKGVRPFLSDNLFEIQRYWIQAYKEQGLRNVTEGPRIVTVDLARVTRDRFFDAIVVRVFATCLDFTIDEGGSVVGGDRTKTREYSEYWTLIRSAAKTGAARSDGACPSCGGPLDTIEMAGHCGHCRAKVTSGEFDWVLSRIEQDEVYEAAE